MSSTPIEIMPLFLQINTNRSVASMEMAMALAMRRGAEYVLVSEPNVKKIQQGKWFRDAKDDAAIGYTRYAPGATATGAGNGFVWVQTAGIYVYSCYISPNTDRRNFEEFVQDLMDDVVKKGRAKIIVTGDFNAKSPMWGSTFEDARGAILADMFSALRLVTLNGDGVPTFVRRASRSVIDVTAITENLVAGGTSWEVLEDEESLSPHRHIVFSIGQVRQLRDRWIYGPINPQRLGEEVRRLTDGTRKCSPEELTNILQEAYASTTPKVRVKNDKAPYWWTNEIAELRVAAVACRRRMTRARARGQVAPEEIIAIEGEYRNGRKELRCAIARSKKQCWTNLVEQLDGDVYGDGYKIVTRAMQVRHPPLNLTAEEKRSQIEKLFPEETRTEWTREGTAEALPFTEEELKEATRKLKNKKAPGRDGIPAEVVKVAVEYAGEYMLRVYNKLLEQQSFPKVWRSAKLILIEKPRKEGAEDKVYRPLCLIDVPGKLYEQLIKGRLEAELEAGGSLSAHQHGFRKGHSTVQAVLELLSKAKDAHHSYPRKWCLAVMLDVRNAFNTANWRKIVDALETKQVSPYLKNLVMEYLTERTICTGPQEERRCNVGVPQGSVLGPSLWNVMYDQVFDVVLPPGLQVIGYADDIVVVGEDCDWEELVHKINTAIARIGRWMRENRLKIAPEKTEAILLRFGRSRKEEVVEVEGVQVPLRDKVKYLGIWLDASVSFGPHIRAAAAKAEAAVKALSRLMPNIGGPGEQARRALGHVAQSIMLYGAPIWEGAMRAERNRKILQRVQRKVALRVCRAYRTTSYEAAMVLASMIPIQLLVEERSQIWRTELPKKDASVVARERTMETWQTEWSGGQKGSWTRELIPDLRPWVERKHGQLGYHLTQGLTGHGSFKIYTHAIGKSVDEACVYCGDVDTAEHTIFQCRRWQLNRDQMQEKIGITITKNNLVETMLRSKENWTEIAATISRIMERKEEDERRGE